MDAAHGGPGRSHHGTDFYGAYRGRAAAGCAVYKYDKKLVAVSSGAIGFGSKVGNGLGALILSGFLMLGAYDATLTEATTSMRVAIYGFSNYLPIVLNVGIRIV